MSLKNNLVRLMREKEITIRSLAERTGISEPTLKRLRTYDAVNPTLDILMKLSSALSTSLPELIQNEIHDLIIKQGQPIILGDDTVEFVYVFTRNTFNFNKGTKAIFKKFTSKSPMTKFILNKNGDLLEKIDDNKFIFKNEECTNFAINQNDILAYIVKELYEVNYV